MNIYLGLGGVVVMGAVTYHFANRIIEQYCKNNKQKRGTDSISPAKDSPSLIERTVASGQPVNPVPVAPVVASTSRFPVVHEKEPQMETCSAVIKKHLSRLDVYEHLHVKDERPIIQLIEDFKYTIAARSILKINPDNKFNPIEDIETRMVQYFSRAINKHLSPENTFQLIELYNQLKNLAPFHTPTPGYGFNSRVGKGVAEYIAQIIEQIKSYVLKEDPIAPCPIRQDESEQKSYFTEVMKLSFNDQHTHPISQIIEIIWHMAEMAKRSIVLPKVGVILFEELEMKIVRDNLSYVIQDYRSAENDLYLFKLKKALENMTRFHQNDSYDLRYINNCIKMIDEQRRIISL